MPLLIKNKTIVQDNWALVQSLTGLPEGNIIVPLALWQSDKEILCQHANLGIWLDSDQEPSHISEDIEHFALIALNFPVFTDGRPYSYARLLRERYGFEGEIRAIGDVLQDQLFYMHRCGFNAFALRQGADLDKALTAFDTFKDSYQTAVEQTVPLFKRR